MTTTTSRSSGARAAAGRLFGGGSATVFALLVLVFVVIAFLNPSFFEPPSLMAFLKKAAPLVVLAVGQYLVIVCGEMDLSVGSLVGAQVAIAAGVIDGEESRTVPTLLLMLLFGALVGLVNGLVVTVLKVHSLIATLGMMLVLYGAIRLWTGGAPTGALSDGFAGVRVWQVRTIAFVLSSLLATVAAVLIGGYAGVDAQVGEGLEFTAITAVVLGGVVLGGGRGTVLAAIAGALTVEALFTLFNQLSLPSTIRPLAQGLIIIAAVAWAARERRRPHLEPTTQP